MAGRATSELRIDLPRSNPSTVRSDEDTIDLLRRLAAHYPDATIAGILNRQGRRSAIGERFTANRINSLSRYWGIPRYQQPTGFPRRTRTITQAAAILGVAPSTMHRWLAGGFIAGDQLTPGAPWQIRVTDDLRERFVEEPPPGWLPVLEATMALVVSRQTVSQRVERGELRAVHVRAGRRKGLRIHVPMREGGLFASLPGDEGAA